MKVIQSTQMTANGFEECPQAPGGLPAPVRMLMIEKEMAKLENAPYGAGKLLGVSQAVEGAAIVLLLGCRVHLGFSRAPIVGDVPSR